MTTAGCRSLGPRIAAIESPHLVPEAVDAQHYPEAAAVILRDVAHLRFLDPKRPRAGYEFSTELDVKVLTLSGRGYGRVSLYLSPWEQLLQVAARSYDPEDPASERRLSVRSIAYRAAAPAAGTLYDEARIAEFDIPGVEVGDIVELRVKTRSRQTFLLPKWYFDGRSPAVMSRFTVDVPKGWDLKWGYWQGAERSKFEPASTDLGTATRLVFEAKALPARTPEPQSGPFTSWGRRLLFSVADGPGEAGRDTLGSWEALGSWYRGLLTNRDVISDEDWARVMQEVKGDTSPARLYAYVRDHVRYVALYEDNLAGYRPHSARAVLKNRFGDCKDMATLLVSLLRRSGQEAYPVLVGVANRVFFDESFPTVSAFNHLVVAMPKPDGSYHFMDPTDKSGVFDAMPWHLEGTGALIVKPDSVDLRRLPKPEAKTHRAQLKYALESGGTLKFEGEFRGVAGAGWQWQADHLPKDIEGRIKAAFFSHFSIDGLSTFSVQTKNGAVLISASAVPRGLYRDIGGSRVLPLAPFLPGRLLTDPVESRTSGVYLNRPGDWRIIVSLPKGRGVVSMPESSEASMAQVSHSFSVKETDNEVLVEAVLHVEDPAVPVAALPALRALDLEIMQARRSAVVTKGDGV